MVSSSCGWVGRRGCRGWIWFLGLYSIHGPCGNSKHNACIYITHTAGLGVLVDKKFHKIIINEMMNCDFKSCSLYMADLR